VAYEQYVIDDEIIGMCCKVLKGIQVDDAHLALEAIEEVGPAGTFITSPHTMTHMRSEYFTGNGVTDQNDRETWKEKGSQDTRTRAREIEKIFLPEQKNRISRLKSNRLSGKNMRYCFNSFLKISTTTASSIKTLRLPKFYQIPYPNLPD